MGVHQLWSLLEPVGRRVNIEALRNKKLAVDASVWIYQFMKARRGADGEMLPNAHLTGFFQRICRLLFHRIRPVFVFDGGVPALKKRTLIARRRRREQDGLRLQRTAERLLKNQLMQHALTNAPKEKQAAAMQRIGAQRKHQRQRQQEAAARDDEVPADLRAAAAAPIEEGEEDTGVDLSAAEEQPSGEQPEAAARHNTRRATAGDALLAAQLQESEQQADIKDDDSKMPFNLVHGKPFTRRHSTFQGHLAEIESVHEVDDVMTFVLNDKQVSRATHNMMAYRVKDPDSGTIEQDCHDDGEAGGGIRLLHMLQDSQAVNVMVVVTRWYGGVQLGPARFMYIVDAARNLLDKGGHVKKPEALPPPPSEEEESAEGSSEDECRGAATGHGSPARRASHSFQSSKLQKEIPPHNLGSVDLSSWQEVVLPDDLSSVDPAVLATLPPSMQLDVILRQRDAFQVQNRSHFEERAERPLDYSQFQMEAYLKSTEMKRAMQKSRERINEAAGAARKGLPSRRIASDYNKEYVLKLENEREPAVKTESGNLSQRPSGGSDGGLELSIDVPEDMQLDELLGPDKSEGSSSSEAWEDVAGDGRGQPSPGTANRQGSGDSPAGGSSQPVKAWRERAQQRQRFWSRTTGFQMGRSLTDWGRDKVASQEEEEEDLVKAADVEDAQLQQAIALSLASGQPGPPLKAASKSAPDVANPWEDEGDDEWEDVDARPAQPAAPPGDLPGSSGAGAQVRATAVQLPPAPRQGSGRSGKPPLAPGRAGQTLREATLLSKEGQAAASGPTPWESALHTTTLAAAGLASPTRHGADGTGDGPDAATDSCAASAAEQPAATAAASAPGSDPAFMASPTTSPSSGAAAGAAAGAAPTTAAPQTGFGGQVRGQGAALLAGRAGVTSRAGQRQHAASQAAAAAGIDVAAQHGVKNAAAAANDTDGSDAADGAQPESTAAANFSSRRGEKPAEGMQAGDDGHAAPISPLPSAFAKAAGNGESGQGQTKLAGQKRRLKAREESLPSQQQPGQQDAEPERLQDEPVAAGRMLEDASGSAGSHRRRQTVISDDADESVPAAAAQQPRALVLEEDDSDQPALQSAAGKPGLPPAAALEHLEQAANRAQELEAAMADDDALMEELDAQDAQATAVGLGRGEPDGGAAGDGGDGTQAEQQGQGQAAAAAARHMHQQGGPDLVPEGNSAPSDEAAAAAEAEVDPFGDFLEGLEGASGDLESQLAKMEQEEERLHVQHQAAMRNAEGPSPEMYGECQELLQLFGLPYIIAAQEAEAQCAWLDVEGLVDGTVTEDNDVFLFGGRHVYRNIFENRKYAEEYVMDHIESELGVDRIKLIHLALLLGSDYTEGVAGVGVVNALEIANHFTTEPLLEEFRKWAGKPDAEVLEALGADESKLDLAPTTPAQRAAIDKFKLQRRKQRRHWQVPEDFPNSAVVKSYEEPKVDASKAAFTFGRPDLDLLRRFCADRFGWDQDKVDQLIQPVLAVYDARVHQQTLDPFLTFSQRFAKIKSKRLQQAVAGSSRRPDPELVFGDSGEEPKPKRQRKSKKAAVGDAEAAGEGAAAGSASALGRKKAQERGRGRGRGRNAA